MFTHFELSAARKAIERIYGSNVMVGNPDRFIAGYDNVSGGAASIGNFNSIMQTGGTFTLSGTFGVPDSGAAGNLTGSYPHRNATWAGITFLTTGGGAFKTWTGTAVTAGDVTIEIDAVTLAFTGTLGAYGTITGQAELVGGTTYRILNASISIPTLFTNIFYGYVTHGAYNDNLGVLNTDIVARYYQDLHGLGSYSFTINAPKTLDSNLVFFDSRERTTAGILVQQMLFSSRVYANFDGVIFPLKIN